MTTSVDSSCLISLFKQEPSAGAVLNELVRCAGESELIISEVVFAETPLAPNIAWQKSRLAELSIRLVRSSEEALFLAGQTFRKYRLEGGERSRVLPDFLVAAHAHIHASQLLTFDRGFFRAYFPRLKIINPLAA